MTSFLTTFVNNNGVWAVLFLMTIESCGIPFPSEVIMPFAGFLVFGGHLSFVAVVLAGATGNLIGSLAAYAIAAQWGEPLLLGPGRKVGIRASHVEMADRWFTRFGLLAVFFGRMVPVVRTYISFPAGLARVKLVPFAILTFVGAVPWCIALAGGGYALGNSWDKVSGPIEKVAIGIALLVVAGVVAWFIRGRRAVGSTGNSV